MPRKRRADFFEEIERIEQVLTQLLDAVEFVSPCGCGAEEGGRSAADVPREESTLIGPGRGGRS